MCTGHSDVFQRMFDTPMAESIDGEVLIQDCSAGTVENLLKYIYYQDISSWIDDMDMAVNMLEIGMKYNIEKLYAECDKVIQANNSSDCQDRFSGITGLRMYMLASVIPQYEHLQTLAVSVMKA